MNSFRISDDKKINIKYAALQGSYWFLASAALAFVTPILESKGFKSSEIGIISSVRCISVVAFQPFAAQFCDRHSDKNTTKNTVTVMGILSAMAGAMLYLIPADLFLAVVISVLFGATVSSLPAMIDALSLQYINAGRKLNYGICRAVGSATWAVGCIILGKLADLFGCSTVIIIQVCFSAVFVLISMIMDPSRTEAGGSRPSEKKKPEESVHSGIYLLTHYPKYTVYLIYCMFLFAGYTLNSTFLIDLYEGMGGTAADYGMAEFVLAVSEIPAVIFIVPVIKKTGLEKLVIISAFFSTIRVLAIALATNVTLAILAQVFEMGGTAVYYASNIYIVKAYLPEADLVKGISYINVASMGVGTTLGSFFSGTVMEMFGIDFLMMVSVYVMITGLAFVVIMKFVPYTTEKHIEETYCQVKQ